MTQAPRMLALPLLLSACVVGNPYEGDTFDSVTTTNASGMTETGTSSSTGDGDGDPATGDGDGDPTTTTTGDGDGDPTTTTGDGDGDPTTTGDGDGDPTTTTGDGDGDPQPECERRRWRYDFEDDSWSSVPLDSVWAGQNAPPCDVEITASSYMELNDQLIVLTADGLYYRRAGNNWVAPQDIAEVFPQIGNAPIDSSIYVPPAGSGLPKIAINSELFAYFYTVDDDGTIVHDDTFPILDERPPGPPQTEFVRTWAFAFGDPDLVGDVAWFGLWQRHTNGRVYRADGGFNWSSWAENDSPPFDGGGPDPAEIEAGWATYAPRYGYVIAP